jgi:hypothetical protein
MEGWRQGRLGSKEDHSTTKGNYKTDLTLTGLLMEGLGIGSLLRWRYSRNNRLIGFCADGDTLFSGTFELQYVI